MWYDQLFAVASFSVVKRGTIEKDLFIRIVGNETGSDIQRARHGTE